MVTITPHTTRATGTILTAAIYNGDHQNHIGNANSLASVVNAIPVISSYGADLIDSANASAALTTLGVSTFAKTLLDDTDAIAARSTLGMGWEVIFNGVKSGAASYPFTDLSPYRTLRMQISSWLPDSSTANWPYMRFSTDNGSTWINAASSYSGTLIYQVEGTATVNGSITPNNTAIPLSWTNQVSNATYGWNGQLQITDFNAALQSRIQGPTSWYTGTSVLHGNFTYRTSAASAFNALLLSIANATPNFSCYVLLEGAR